jgi:hypothetical protein
MSCYISTRVKQNACFQKGCNEKWVLVCHFRVRGMQDNLMLQARTRIWNVD